MFFFYFTLFYLLLILFTFRQFCFLFCSLTDFVYNSLYLFIFSISTEFNEFLLLFFRLMAIVKSGGPEKLCQLWHRDVYEARHNIMRTFRHLLQNDLFFCAKSDVEFFVWKICFYNLVATLKTWLQGGTIPQAERQVVEENVIELLDEGLEFYTEMLDTLDKTYNIGKQKVNF